MLFVLFIVVVWLNLVVISIVVCCYVGLRLLCNVVSIVLSVFN